MAAKEVLLGLMNDLNQPKRPFSEINVGLSDVTAVVHESGDTKLTVTGVPGRGYFGSVDVFFKRIPLADAFGDKQLRSLVALTPEIVLQLLNASVGGYLTVDDLEPFSTPTPEEGTGIEIILTAKPESLGFTGQIVVSVEYGKSWLDSVIGFRILGIMTHPIIPAGKQCGRMITWNKDFTCLRDAIKPGKDATVTDWDRLQTGCAAMGIPSWYKGNSVVDYAVANVPDANPLFDRVVIQRDVFSNYIEGPLYFHYNVLEEV